MRPPPSAPSLLDAVAPVVVLILLIALTIVIFGTGAADGPLQIALLVSAAFAGLVAFKNGYTDASVRRAYRDAFARAGLAPRMLSRTVEDSGTVTSPLVPWNSCGAYMTGVLGVPTIEYLPYAIFNIANPLIALLFGFTESVSSDCPRRSASACPGGGVSLPSDNKRRIPPFHSG